MADDAYRRGYDLIDWSKPLPKIYKPRIAPARGAFPCPMLASDMLDEPLYSGADGRLYTSKAALRASYLPSGNPDGIRYDEVGNETIPLTPPEPDTAGIDASIQKAISRLNA